MTAARQSHVNYWQAILNLNNEGNDFVSKIIMNDEAHFHLNGYINKRSLHFSATEIPRVIHE